MSVSRLLAAVVFVVFAALPASALAGHPDPGETVPRRASLGLTTLAAGLVIATTTALAVVLISEEEQ